MDTPDIETRIQQYTQTLLEQQMGQLMLQLARCRAELQIVAEAAERKSERSAGRQRVGHRNE